jgi:hypothetical protein
MFGQINEILNDPISIEAFYSEMRMCNDPKTGHHADDYNQMVNFMVQESKHKGAFPVSQPTGTLIGSSFPLSTLEDN